MKKLISIFIVALLGLSTPGSAAITGDIDGDNVVNVSDVTALINQILSTAGYQTSCDVNADGAVNVTDVTTVINIILGVYEDPNLKLTGADISLLDRYEEHGALYYDKTGAQVTDMLAFYKQIGLNAMRVRLFVDPANATASAKGEGVFQDLAYVAKAGKRIKNAGHKFILDFHYSDSWADPGKQSLPKRWSNLTPEVLADSVYAYTRESLQALVAAGATPDYVQVGNEITYGMLWPTGSIYPDGANNKGTWANFSAYFNAGAKAVREVLPSAKIICHIEMANNSNPGKFFGIGAKNYNLDYDIMGLSYYPAYHATASNVISALESVIKQLKVQVADKPIMIMETGYSYRWAMGGTKDTNISKTYPYTEAGQAQFVADLVKMLNQYECVKGLFWWCAEQNEYGLDWNTNRVLDNWWQASLVDNENGKILQGCYELANFK